MTFSIRQQVLGYAHGIKVSLKVVSQRKAGGRRISQQVIELVGV